ncbi:MAG: hypothetical protein R3223_01080, partial [Longimicrobiales bacterium]|nr:hypothetical protein [Longimicrobiales bacterium]
VNGWSVGEVPPEWAGGLGVEGSRSIRDFVRNGGRLVAVEQATDFVVRILGLDVDNAVERLPAEEFFAPGSLVQVTLEREMWEGDSSTTDIEGVDDGPRAEERGAGGSQVEDAGPSDPDPDPETETETRTGSQVAQTPSLPGEVAAWFGPDSRGFTVTDPTVRILARYGEIDPLLSGWMVGRAHLSRRPAVVEAGVGRGSVVLFGFQPNYRGQSVATWPLLFDALITEAPETTGRSAGGDP